MAHEFCNPLKTHKFEHHEKLGIGFMGFSTPLKTCEILMAFFMGISWSCVWWRKIHGPRIWKFSKDFHGIFHGIFMAKTHEKAIKKPGKMPWIYHEKINRIFMGFNFIVYALKCCKIIAI